MQTADVVRIDIYSRWVGFASPPSHSDKCELVRQGDVFSRRDVLTGQHASVSGRLIQRLIELIAKGAQSFDPDVFGIPREKVEEHYRDEWTDDYPRIRVKLLLADGAVVLLDSESQHAFMIPWKVTTGETWFKTSDPGIGRAIASILPFDFSERRRLQGDSLDPKPPSTVEAMIEIAGSVRSSGGSSPSNSFLMGPATPLMAAASPPFNADLFQVLVRQGVSVNARRTDGLTGLMISCLGGMDEAVKAWITAGADVNLRGPDGETTLMLGAGWMAIVRELVAAGADVNSQDDEGSTALMYAIAYPYSSERQKVEIAQALLAAGANVCLADKDGKTAVDHVERYSREAAVEVEVEQELAPEVWQRRQEAPVSIGGGVTYDHSLTDGKELLGLLHAAEGRGSRDLRSS
jgi:hypothetical protein